MMRNVKTFPPAIETHPVQRLMVSFARFAQMESAGSIALLFATITALVLANSHFADTYRHFIEFPMSGSFGHFSVRWNFQEFVNDALMAYFFLLVGLEVKREILVGQLATARRALLPLLGALGGVVAPALLYWAVNRSGPEAAGWGIPIATDIAFALATVGIFGSRVPVGLRMFLLTLAVIDDIAGVFVIAVAYSGQLHLQYLALACLLFLIALGLNRAGVISLATYLVIGVALWVAFYASGVHATLAGVAIALAIPAEGLLPSENFLEEQRDRLTEVARSAEMGHPLSREARRRLHRIRSSIKVLESPLDRMESRLHPWVSFGILPLFALVNAGVSLRDVQSESVLTQPMFYGIMLGLLVGKPVGIMLACWIAVRLRLAELPVNVRWRELHAVSWLGGIGFTVSIFIADLAFRSSKQYTISRIAIFAASLCAASIGAAMLAVVYPRSPRRRKPGVDMEPDSGK